MHLRHFFRGSRKREEVASAFLATLLEDPGFRQAFFKKLFPQAIDILSNPCWIVEVEAAGIDIRLDSDEAVMIIENKVRPGRMSPVNGCVITGQYSARYDLSNRFSPSSSPRRASESMRQICSPHPKSFVTMTPRPPFLGRNSPLSPLRFNRPRTHIGLSKAGSSRSSTSLGNRDRNIPERGRGGFWRASQTRPFGRFVLSHRCGTADGPAATASRS